MVISQELIGKGGSKLEITRALLEQEVDVPIPNSIWLYYGQSLDSIREDFERLRKPVIARGSHTNDYHGFVDVVPTRRGIQDFSELEESIKYAEGFMHDEEVKIHCQYWGEPYTPEVHFLIQEQSPSPIVGSMIRHPHERKILRIQYFDVSYPLMDRFNSYSWAGINSAGDFSHDSRVNRNPYIEYNISDENILELIRMFEVLEACGILDPSLSYQVEFGLHPLFFFQARPFKKFEPAEDFKVPRYELDFPNIYTNNNQGDCFGITSPTGIDIPFCIDRFDDIWVDTPFSKSGERYGIIKNADNWYSPPLDIKIGNLTAFLWRGHNGIYLSHDTYRFLKKAEHSLIYSGALRNVGITEGEEDAALEEFKESRLICNGREGILIPTKYL